MDVILLSWMLLPWVVTTTATVKKPYFRLRYKRGVPGPKHTPVDEFPFCCHLVLDDLHLYVTKTSCKDSFHMCVLVHPFHVICINNMLSCVCTDRFTTREKPYDTVVRGNHQIIVSKKWCFTNMDRGDYLSLRTRKESPHIDAHDVQFIRATSRSPLERNLHAQLKA
ncbi:hypothetical protein BDR04DRAFT_1127346 [Suillus decipiens]|nr:hypothetical protein BDR04DRAFT_1127346 [Suillus decipiens]